MPQLTPKTLGGADPTGKPRVYFTCHPLDFDLFFEPICKDLFTAHDCAVYYTEDMETEFSEEEQESDLNRMNLFVLPVTRRLLTSPCRAMQSDAVFAREKNIPILPILIIGYIIPLVITFFVPPIYTGIAFDSGGVASGPMATTFILPFAIGACEALGGNVMTDAFGIVAMIAMTPLITIQVLGLIGKTKQDRMMRKIHMEIEQIDDGMVYYDEEAL